MVEQERKTDVAAPQWAPPRSQRRLNLRRARTLVAGFAAIGGSLIAAPPPGAPQPAPRSVSPPTILEPCSPGPYVVLFDPGRTELSPRGEFILDNAAEYFRSCAYSRLTIAGHADRSGGAAYNLRLSRFRAENVRAYLASRGVPVSAMVTEAFGGADRSRRPSTAFASRRIDQWPSPSAPSGSLSGTNPSKSFLTPPISRIV